MATRGKRFGRSKKICQTWCAKKGKDIFESLIPNLLLTSVFVKAKAVSGFHFCKSAQLKLMIEGVWIKKKKKSGRGLGLFFFACIFYRLSFKVLVQQSGSADLIRTLLRSQAKDFSSSALLWLLVLIFTLIRVLDTASEPQTHPEECTHFSCLRNHFQSLSASLRLQLPPLIWCPCR